MAHRAASPRRQRPLTLTERDLVLLSFLAEHRLALPTHAAVLLGVSVKTAGARLTRLDQGGFARGQDPVPGEPRWYRITRKGLATIGSGLPPPRIDLRTYRHDVGVAWVWLAARSGTFGPLAEIIAERRLRSQDAGRASGSHSPGPHPSEPGRHPPGPLGVRLGGFGPRGGARLHYPDLVLRTADGRRIALELELSSKGRPRLETILSGYGADSRFDGVVYLVESRSVAQAVERAARRLGISRLVHVQRVRSTVSRPAAAAALSAERVAPARTASAGHVGVEVAR